jgi:hypothetical protein
MFRENIFRRKANSPKEFSEGLGSCFASNKKILFSVPKLLTNHASKLWGAAPP